MPSAKMFLPTMGGWDSAGLPSGYGVLASTNITAGTHQMSPVIQAASPMYGPPAETSPPISNLLRRDPLPSQQSAPRTSPLVPTGEHGHPRRASTPLFATASASTTYPAPPPPFVIPVAGPSTPSLYQRRQQPNQGDPSRTLADPLPWSMASPSSTAIDPRLPPFSPQHPVQRPDAAVQSLAELALHRPPSRPQPVKLPKPSIAALRYLRGDRVVGQIMLSRYFDGTDTQNEALYKSLMEDLDKLETIGHPLEAGTRAAPLRTAETRAVDGPARTAPAHDRPSSAVPDKPSPTTLSINTCPALAGPGSFTRSVQSDRPEPILTPSATPSPLFASHPLETRTSDPRPASDSTTAQTSGLSLKLKFRRPPPTASVARTDPEPGSDADDTPLAQQQPRKKRRTLSPRPASPTRVYASEEIQTPRTNDDAPPDVATESQTGGSSAEGPMSDDDLPVALLRRSPVRRRPSSRTFSLAPEGSPTSQAGVPRLPRSTSLPVGVAEAASISTMTVLSPTIVAVLDGPPSSIPFPVQTSSQPQVQGENRSASSSGMEDAPAGGVSLAAPPAAPLQSRSEIAIEASATGMESSSADRPTAQYPTLAENSPAEVQESTEAIVDRSAKAEGPATDIPANGGSLSASDGPSGVEHAVGDAEEGVEMDIDEPVGAESVARRPSTISPPPVPQTLSMEVAQEIATTDEDPSRASSGARDVVEPEEEPPVDDHDVCGSTSGRPAEAVANVPALRLPSPSTSQVQPEPPRLPSLPVVDHISTPAVVNEEQDVAIEVNGPRALSPISPVVNESSPSAPQPQTPPDPSTDLNRLPPHSLVDEIVPQAPLEPARSHSVKAAAPAVATPAPASHPSPEPLTHPAELDEAPRMDINDAAQALETPPPPADRPASPPPQLAPTPPSSAPPQPRLKARPPPSKMYAPPPKVFTSTSFVPFQPVSQRSDVAADDAQARIDALLGKWSMGGRKKKEDGTVAGVVDLGWVWK